MLLDAGGITLSGLLAEPPDEPRAVVVGLHGGGMDARYFDGQAHPSLSLLTLLQWISKRENLRSRQAS